MDSFNFFMANTRTVLDGLGLEDAWLFGERTDALAGLGCCLLLQLQVEHAGKPEGAYFLQLISRHAHDAFHNAPRLLLLQARGLRN